jgi:flagellar motor protein MotB
MAGDLQPQDERKEKRMNARIAASAIGLTLGALPAVCQQGDSRNGPVPIYRITVIERTMKAVNYAYRSGPTMIDLRGTVLMPKLRGEAVVESRQGRTEIDARLENLTPSQRFGGEYLTYVLWAITPEGRPHNIGEMIANGSNKTHLHVTTGLQAFGLIVTAEPYSAVRLPSDVVVAENQIRPDTIGKIEEVDAKYELMPRGVYTLRVSEGLTREPGNAPKVSMGEYEALLELYQAQNAIALAKAARAGQYAPDTLAKAQQLLDEAQQFHGNKTAPRNRVVESAREATQTAEDARVLAEQRQQQEKLAQVEGQVSAAQQARAQAEAEAERARADAGAAQAAADAERSARLRAEGEAAAARERAAQAERESQASQPQPTPPAAALRPQLDQGAAQKGILRRQLFDQLNRSLITRDTPRGLVVTIPDRGFSGALLREPGAGEVARASALIVAYPGLRVEVEGYTDSDSSEALASRRAQAVRETLIARGVPSAVVSARGFGNSRPLVSNSTESGREENRRVEIVISGEPIGNLPVWDRTYTLTQRKN